MLPLLLACAVPEPADSAPGETAAPEDSPACAGIPVLTWETFGQGFLISQCDGCHAAASTNRHDAPEDVVFDTVDQAWAWAPRILSRATGEAPTMPPEGGVSEDDRTRLEWWLTCGVEGT